MGNELSNQYKKHEKGSMYLSFRQSAATRNLWPMQAKRAGHKNKGPTQKVHRPRPVYCTRSKISHPDCVGDSKRQGEAKARLRNLEFVRSPDTALRPAMAESLQRRNNYASFLRIRAPCLRPFFERVSKSGVSRLLTNSRFRSLALTSPCHFDRAQRREIFGVCRMWFRGSRFRVHGYKHCANAEGS